MLIFHRRQLQVVLSKFIEHYNVHRPHQGLFQEIPAPTLPSPMLAATPAQLSHSHPLHVRRRDRLGGLIHEHELTA
jgi:hypothetical protein